MDENVDRRKAAYKLRPDDFMLAQLSEIEGAAGASYTTLAANAGLAHFSSIAAEMSAALRTKLTMKIEEACREGAERGLDTAIRWFDLAKTEFRVGFEVGYLPAEDSADLGPEWDVYRTSSAEAAKLLHALKAGSR